MLIRSFTFVLGSIAIGGFAILLLIPIIWAILFLGVFIGVGNFKVWGHQEFAANGVSQIEPAAQMNHLFKDCRHFIVYGAKDQPLFNTDAYFGGRYVLTMQVPVAIVSRTSGRMIGDPTFHLNEVGRIEVSPSGQVGAYFSRNLEFGMAQWKQVYKADGDWSAIGFDVNPNAVKNFEKYAAACRPSN